MTITSFSFWIFLLLFVCIYYLWPSKNRWLVLLCASISFFVLASGWQMILYMLFGVVVAYIGAYAIHCSSNTKTKKFIMFIVVLLIIGELASLKYVQFAAGTIGKIAELFGKRITFDAVSVIAPIGISYYSLSLIGYVLDVYWEKYAAEKNFFKIFLFGIYFPQLTSGPITRYDEMKTEFFGERKFNHITLLYGIQRIIWGLFKKLVIANRAAIFVQTVYGNYELYNGYYIVIAVLLFALQLYADFSGCMDIIMGASQCFGVELPENFDTPFASQSVTEFWRRWHITMGNWFKDYLLYPILKSNFIQKIKKFLKKHVSKKASKEIPTYMGLFVIWVAIGIWHGGSWKFIFASGVIPGFYLVMGQVFMPIFEKINKVIGINTEARSWKMFRSVRTFLCLCTSWILISAGSLKGGFNVVKAMFANNNPWVLSDDSLYMLGLSWKDFNILYIGILIMCVVGILHKNSVNIREKLVKQNLFAQWLIMLIALFSIIILGIYGPGYDAASFIYENF